MNEVILRSKRGKEQEYTLHLFEFCNLSCQFCWQDHDNIKGLDSILLLMPSIEGFLASEQLDSVVFNVMGGELFAPKIYTPELNEVYKELSSRIQSLCLSKGIEGKMNWVTNLVTDKNDQIEGLLQHCSDIGIKSTLTTSYDPRGRFDKKSFQNYKDNVEYWGDRVIDFSCILTESNINHYLNRGDEYFEYLYSIGKVINFDYLMPTTVNMPTNGRLLEFFKFCVDKFPKTEPIRGWIERSHNNLTCRTTKVVLSESISGGEITTCTCGGLEENAEAYSSDIETNSNKQIEEAFLEKYNCVSCEYFNRCTMGCFMHFDYVVEDDLDECLYKLVHRYIEGTTKIELFNAN